MTSIRTILPARIFSVLIICVSAAAILGCSTQPVAFPKSESASLISPDDTTLGDLAIRFAEAHADSSGLYPLFTGIDSFDTRTDLIRDAVTSVDIQVFLYHEDRVGNLFGAHLFDAADRGVRVRLLLDDYHSGGVESSLLAASQHSNIEVRLFNPFTRERSQSLELVGNFSRLNRRMHNKSFIVDGRVAVVGGRNVGDEYFEGSEDTSFLDMDLLCVGPIISQLSAEFDRYWNSSQAVPIEAFADKLNAKSLQDARGDSLRAIEQSASTSFGQAMNSEILPQLMTGDLQWVPANVTLLFDEPEPGDDPDHGMVMAAALAQLGAEVEKDLFLVTPYFVPQKGGVKILSDIAARGARVRVLTNSLASTNQVAVHAGYKRYRKELLRAGVELYELVPWVVFEDYPSENERINLTLHAKVFAIDGQKLFVGSFNLDPRSADINTEIGLVASSRAITLEYLQMLEGVLDDVAYKVTLDESNKLRWAYTGANGTTTATKEPETSWWRRTKVWFIGLLPVEGQL
jgi:putative cardiolipin synthase